MWFEALTGFREEAVDDVAGRFAVDGEHITSKANGRTMRVGRFETPTLAELRARAAAVDVDGALALDEVVADVQQLHVDPDNRGALFQVASQFNTLEMVSPSVTPEQGIARYAHDRTQGPACAVACGAGTIHRNYLVAFDDGIGQTATRQIDCLADVAGRIGVPFAMRNGYALPGADELAAIAEAITTLDTGARDDLAGRLRIGLQHDTEVTLDGGGHEVTQAYCSALPVAYADHPVDLWEPFARFVLDAAYEATLAAAVVNRASTGNRLVYLTLLGGGAFGNPTSWIIDAIRRATGIHAAADLDVRIVSYGRPSRSVRALLYEAELKATMWEKMRQERGDEYMERNAGYLELEWEWARQLGFTDPD